MISTIQSILGPFLGTAAVASSPQPDIFEAYIMSLVLKAAQEEGASISYEHRDGSSASSLILRVSPGYIYSTAKNYTHALIRFPARPALEAHTGIKITGKSGVLHEADVAVLESAEAENCRLNSVSPRSSKVLISVECKFYSSALQLHLARGFVGLVRDLSAKNPYFVTNTNSSSVEKLLSHRVRHWEKDICPTCRNNEVQRLTYDFRTSFKNYKAR